MLNYLIQLGFEVVANLLAIWMSLRLWRSKGVSFSMCNVKMGKWMQAYMVLLGMLCYANVGYIMRHECFVCSRTWAGKTCSLCEGALE